MQVFKTRWFARYARRERIDDKSLREAIERAERGLIDADLGGGLIKQRVARAGKGKSGGYRTIVAYRTKKRAVFLFAFAKSNLSNIGTSELLSLRSDGWHWLGLDAVDIEIALHDGAIEEVSDGKES
jgi:hypothetical protein